MEKDKIVNTIKEIKETINASDKLVETCIYIANKMVVDPSVRSIIEDEYFGSGIAFDYNDENGLSVEIFVSQDEIWGYIDYNNNDISNFAFENENDAVNFWNIVVGKLV